MIGFSSWSLQNIQRPCTGRRRFPPPDAGGQQKKIQRKIRLIGAVLTAGTISPGVLPLTDADNLSTFHCQRQIRPFLYFLLLRTRMTRYFNPFRPVCFYCILFLLTAFIACPAASLAADNDTSKSTLSPQVEQALDALLAAANAQSSPKEQDVTSLLRFVAQAHAQKAEKVVPGDRQGKGAFYTAQLSLPLRKLMSYLLTPGIPGEALYPVSVRHNHWEPGSAIFKDSARLIDAPFPPAAPVSLRGIELEETTPDTSSGCFYRYKLNRLFVLAAIDGRTALICVSVMPGKSSIGKKGLIVDESNWRYVYTAEQGTNLSMLGWAETQIYASSGITIYMENAAGGTKTDVAMFKWTRAGWSGMNVVKASHIKAGIKRFIKGLRQVVESPRCPSPAAIVAEAARLQKLDDNALRALLADEAKVLATSKAEGLDDAPYSDAVKDGRYASTLQHEALCAEAVKLWMRKQILGR